jgi:hypothetical protein
VGRGIANETKSVNYHFEKTDDEAVSLRVSTKNKCAG